MPSSSYFNPDNPYNIGTDIDYKIDVGAIPTWKPDPDKEFDWTAQKEEEPTFGDNFKTALKENIGAYTKRYAGAGDKREGDTYVRSPGATVADLGGGNTLYVPDTTTQMRMAQAGQQGSSGGGIGRMAGSILGQAGGAALGGSAALAGTALGSALGPLGAIAGGALGGLLPF